MSNQLKFDTADSIGVLNGANIRNIMITGDNVLTAVNVAKQCYLMNPDKPVFISTVHKGNFFLLFFYNFFLFFFLIYILLFNIIFFSIIYIIIFIIFFLIFF